MFFNEVFRKWADSLFPSMGSNSLLELCFSLQTLLRNRTLGDPETLFQGKRT